mmetsp:Transcript_22027/g.43370  ORF Transcript_22027/g.43370 Transcript_22027/m.43370 type:complete len:292 (-) Transcript_22027:493-1368(-)
MDGRVTAVAAGLLTTLLLIRLLPPPDPATDPPPAPPASRPRSFLGGTSSAPHPAQSRERSCGALASSRRQPCFVMPKQELRTNERKAGKLHSGAARETAVKLWCLTRFASCAAFLCLTFARLLSLALSTAAEAFSALALSSRKSSKALAASSEFKCAIEARNASSSALSCCSSSASSTSPFPSFFVPSAAAAPSVKASCRRRWSFNFMRLAMRVGVVTVLAALSWLPPPRLFALLFLPEGRRWCLDLPDDEADTTEEPAPPLPSSFSFLRPPPPTPRDVTIPLSTFTTSAR